MYLHFTTIDNAANENNSDDVGRDVIYFRLMAQQQWGEEKLKWRETEKLFILFTSGDNFL